MQDFLLDFRSVWGHISEGGYLEFRELCGAGVFRVSDFVLLGFLNFLGYRADGWDTEYRVDATSLMYDGTGWSCRQYVNAKLKTNCCDIVGSAAVVDLKGILYSDVMKLEGAMVERCLVPVDLGIYFTGLQEFFWGTKGFVIDERKSVVYDLSLFDDCELDLSRYYKEMYAVYSFNCFGWKFTEWLLLEHVFLHWQREKDFPSKFTLLGALRLNRVYVGDIVLRAAESGRGEGYKAALLELLGDAFGEVV